MAYVTLGTVSANKKPLLKKGSSGGDVHAAQALLNSWRASVGKNVLPSNGKYDAVMVAAVKDFQRTFKIGVDGKIGPETWYTLINRKAPARSSRQTDSNIPLDFSPSESSPPAWVLPAMGAVALLLLFLPKK